MSLRWKLIISFAVLVIFATVGVYPIVAAYYNLPMPGALREKQLKLGLDLKGGVHLVLRVQTDDALRVEISRNAVVGYQGQEPIVPESGANA